MPFVPPQRSRRLLRKLLLSVAFGVLLLEALLRLFDLQVPLGRIWRWHATLGWTQDPRAKFDYVFDGEPVHAEFNRLGFRDVEHAALKPPGVRRIVILGDSFCEAVQVNLEQTFFRRLEAMLDARGVDCEVINLGVGDWGQAQQSIVLRELGLGYAPDLVICQVFPLNDVCNNGIELYGLGRSHNDLYRPYFADQDGVLTATHRDPWRHRLRCLSRVFLNLERAATTLSWSLTPGSDADRWQARAVAAGFTGLPPLLHTYVPHASQPPAVQSGWAMTERLLTEMRDTCGRNGIAFLGLVMAWEATLGPAWEPFAAGQPPPPMQVDYPEQRLGELFARLRTPVVLTRAWFAARLAEFLPCRDGHLGPGGHRIVAEALLQAIDEHALLR